MSSLSPDKKRNPTSDELNYMGCNIVREASSWFNGMSNHKRRRPPLNSFLPPMYDFCLGSPLAVEAFRRGAKLLVMSIGGATAPSHFAVTR